MGRYVRRCLYGIGRCDWALLFRGFGMISWYFWKFVHNAIIHPFLSMPYEPKWAQRAHDWTAARCWGGG
jgi:hypothetical protein